jgi:hypothetical protein
MKLTEEKVSREDHRLALLTYYILPYIISSLYIGESRIMAVFL